MNLALVWMMVCGLMACSARISFAAEPASVKRFDGEALVVKGIMEDLFEASKKVNRKGPEGKDARSKIENSVDWDQISEGCLGKGEWKKQSVSNRNKFENLLREVIVKTAFSRLDKFWNGTKYTFEKIDISSGDSQAHVLSKFTVDPETFQLEYFLSKKGTQWRIHDIAYEDMRYSANISEQIGAFLKEESFNGLLDKLRKRRDALDRDSKTS